jgi:hypothetical protein
MTDKPRTGSVISRSGKVTARRIITGVEIEGAASDAVLKAALEVMDRLHTGGVSGAQGVEVSEDIVTGFRHLNPQAPDRESFVAAGCADRAAKAAGGSRRRRSCGQIAGRRHRRGPEEGAIG